MKNVQSTGDVRASPERDGEPAEAGGKAPRGAVAKGRRGAPTRPAGRRRGPEEVHARILKAAVAEFAEHSFSGGRIERISKRAKTVDRMIYYYFGSKERLYQSVLEQVYGELIAAQRRFEVNEDDPVAGMRELILQLWQHYLDHPEFVRLVATENLLRARYVKKASTIRSTLLPLVERIGQLLEAGRRQGVFRADADPQRMLMTMMSLGFFYVANQYTCSRWLEVDLMEAKRLRAWGEHICEVVLDHLQCARRAGEPSGGRAAVPGCGRRRRAGPVP